MKEKRNISDGDLIFPAVALSKECAIDTDEQHIIDRLKELRVLIDKKDTMLVLSQDNYDFVIESFQENKNNNMAKEIYFLIKLASNSGRIWINDKLPSSFLDNDADNLIIFNGLNTILINLDQIPKKSSIIDLYNSASNSNTQLLSLDRQQDSFLEIKTQFEKPYLIGDLFTQAVGNFDILIKWCSSITIVDSYAIKNHKSIIDNPKDHKNIKSGLENFLTYLTGVLTGENKKLNRLRYFSWSGKSKSNPKGNVGDWKNVFNELIEECGIESVIKKYDPGNESGYGILLAFASDNNHDRFIVFERDRKAFVYKCGKGLESINSISKKGEKEILMRNFTIVGPGNWVEWTVTKNEDIQKILSRQKGEFYHHPFN